MESYDDYKCDRVYQPANTCDGNVENETPATITSMQSEENVEGVSDIGGRSSNREESDEDVKMTVEEGEVFCQKRGNWFSEVGEKEEDAVSPDHEICNDDLHDQNDASQAKVQGLQELCKDPSFGVIMVNENKEEEDGGISERKTQELSSKDKSEKQPSNLCGDNLLGRKSGDSTRSSPESSLGQNNQVRHLCQVCDYSTDHKSNLSDHMSKHSEERPYVCEICNKRFKLKHHLQEHKTTHNGDKQFQCDYCGQRFSRMSHLKRHLVTHKTLHSGDKQFQCDNCGRRFSRKESMKRHLITHTERPFKCKTCGMDFRRKSHLHDHEKTQHNKNAPVFPCNYCQYSSKHKRHTKAHEIRKHSKTYPHTCNVCKCGFIRPYELKRHMISKHKKQK